MNGNIRLRTIFRNGAIPLQPMTFVGPFVVAQIMVTAKRSSHSSTVATCISAANITKNTNANESISDYGFEATMCCSTTDAYRFTKTLPQKPL